MIFQIIGELEEIGSRMTYPADFIESQLRLMWSEDAR
jgi:hypothetical protein